MIKDKRKVGILIAGAIGAVSALIGAMFAGAVWQTEVYAKDTYKDEIGIDYYWNEDMFPDENFREYVFSSIDKNYDYSLSEEEVSSCKKINCAGMEINNLSGIEYFVNLESLVCNNNSLYSLDVSKNTKLRELNCSENNLKNIDLSKNTALQNINCDYNKLNNLDISRSKDLEVLNCCRNNLSSLNVSKNTKLTSFSCDYNNLRSLDVRKNVAIRLLSCCTNNLSSLDVSKNTALEYFRCYNNNLSSLDVSKNTALEEFGCGDNNLSRLDVSKNTALEYFICPNNNLSSLDVSKNTVLRRLDCSWNNLRSLDVSKNTVLRNLNCSENNLKRLDLSKNTVLESLLCHDNNIKDLDLSKNTALQNINCDNNKLNNLDISKNKQLLQLYCFGNHLCCLDICKNKALVGFGADNQTRDVKAINGEIMLSALSPNLVASNITNLKGATLSGNKLINIKNNTITYDYKINDYKINDYKASTMDVALSVKNLISVTEVKLNKTTANTTVGGVIQLTTTVSPANATNKGVTWSSSNTAVAAVDANGKVTAKKDGTAKITVKTEYGGKTATCTVTVKNKIVNVTGVKLDKASANITKSNTLKLTATVSPVNASNKAVTWSSSNKNVATVDANGNVKAVNPGTATITVKTKDGGKTATCKVTVPNVWKRLWGQGRYDTMKAIVNEGFKGTGGTVIVATGSNFKDALAASGLAGLENAPVVLTDGNTLSGQAKDVLNRIKPKKIYIAGGPAAVSDKVVSAIKSVTGVNPQRTYGQNSTETSAKLALAGKGKWKDATAIIATNKSFKDALSVAPIAYVKKYPVLLADNGKSLSKPVLNALKSLGVKNVIIVGGKAAVTTNVEKQIKSAGIKVKTRLWGNNAVETSKKIAEWGIKNGMSANKMGVATSQNFPDALAGAAFCGKNKSVLVLADDNANLNATFPKVYKTKVNQGYVFGGEMAVGKKTMTTLENSVKI